jgi:hypothetical protein
VKQMRRSMHIAVAATAVLLLVRPFDCFAGGAPSKKVADCCLKGKCAPTAKSDECCKNTVPAAGQLLTSKAVDHSSPLITLTTTGIPILISTLMFDGLVDTVRHPPPRIGLTTPNLPLLI